MFVQAFVASRLGCSRECRDGAFLDSVTGAGYPADADCVAPADCDLADLSAFNVAYAHMTTAAAATGTAAHGDEIEYPCADGKRMTNTAKDHDGDGNGEKELVLQSLW